MMFLGKDSSNGIQAGGFPGFQKSAAAVSSGVRLVLPIAFSSGIEHAGPRFPVWPVRVPRRDRRAAKIRPARIKLRGQPVSVLKMLLEHPGEIISREDLQKRLWPEGTYVDFEHSTNAVVKRLRQVLSDSADAPRFIETLARSGYRFISPVSFQSHEMTSPLAGSGSEVPEAAVQDKARSQNGFHTLPAMALGIVVIMAIGGGLAVLREGGAKSAG